MIAAGTCGCSCWRARTRRRRRSRCSRRGWRPRRGRSCAC
uniref:Uncharacterized protein n=1 Tax=Arundo donax TaxID=35708 RepID=A0A0A9BN64_ARUDO